MSWISALRNIVAHQLHRAEILWEGRSRATSRVPSRPKGARKVELGQGEQGQGLRARVCPYVLLPQPVQGQHPSLRAPDGWQPRPGRGLVGALPFPWDARYTEVYDQPFQPVKLWRNAIALARDLETAPSPERARATRSILGALLGQMRLYTVENAGVSYLENRFDYTLPNHQLIQGPWVSGIANAFAILTCLRLRPHLDLLPEAEAYARAYFHPQIENGPVQDRWISFLDRRGYLWFEEYPQSGGRATRVQNGHVFAVLALHELSLHRPGQGYDQLARAGATTIAAYAACFRQKRLPPLYALGLPGIPDYLPNRAMRQMFQLYEMTGAERFLRYGDHFTTDWRRKLDPDLEAAVLAQRAASVASRQRFGQRP